MLFFLKPLSTWPTAIAAELKHLKEKQSANGHQFSVAAQLGGANVHWGLIF